MDKIVVVTGGFDPLHSGHIAYINAAAEHGRVIVGLNSDSWLSRKKGSAFMSFYERECILKNIKKVMAVIPFDDSDNTACDAIVKAKQMFPNNVIVFANGGDRSEYNIPEIDYFKDDSSVEFMFGVGGEQKQNSSSWILNDWKYISEDRIWGKFITYYVGNACKLKKLEIDPGKGISMQYHLKRTECWFVESGLGSVYTLENSRETNIRTLMQNDMFTVPTGMWHRLENIGSGKLNIIEIQFGTECSEEDIVRYTRVAQR